MIGKVLFEYDELPSTNEMALEIAMRNDVVEGAVVQALHQSCGRGQRGTRWHSEPGQNLLLSIILKPTFLTAEAQFYLNKTVALAVADTLEHFVQFPVSIKWPNDIYVLEKKIAGILIQNTIQSQKIAISTIGIGLNVNQTHFDTTLPNPTSLHKLMRQRFDLKVVRQHLFDALNDHYQRLRIDVKYGDEQYLKQLYRRSEMLEFETLGGEKFIGAIVDVDRLGRLMIKDDQGQIRFFTLKQVSYQ